jgi:molybdopterin-guanine dinucleotide biosynthesis protein B
VHRAANGKPWMHPDMPGIVAVASDTPPPYDLPSAGLDEVEAIADLVLAEARPIKDIAWTEG